MRDKVQLLIEETGCDRGEAELALSMCGYEVEEAVRAIPRLLKNIVVLKGKFALTEADQYGLFLVILNTKSGVLVRSRAVLSYNPAVYTVSLEKDWFEFEKQLYACRLWEGSLPPESLELEQALALRFRGASPEDWERLGQEAAGHLGEQLSAALAPLFRGRAPALKLQRDILDLGQFQSLRGDSGPAARPAGRSSRPLPRADELLVLRLSVEEDPKGIAAANLRAGDMVSARIVDARDIAQYLAKLFGGHSEGGPTPILVPVEAIEAVPTDRLLVRVRFSLGVCGDAEVATDAHIKAVRVALRHQDRLSWWRRIFKV